MPRHFDLKFRFGFAKVLLPPQIADALFARRFEDKARIEGDELAALLAGAGPAKYSLGAGLQILQVCKPSRLAANHKLLARNSKSGWRFFR